MKTHPFPFGLVFLILAGCASTSKVEKAEYGPSKPKYSISVDKNGRKEGQETWWYVDGTLKYQSHNRAGIRDGKYTAWYPDGKKWYEGLDVGGKSEGALTYWHPNGKVKSQALFRDGIQLERKDFDLEGRYIDPNPAPAPSHTLSGDGQDSVSGSGAMRRASLQMWAMRVRRTVESFWVLPQKFQKDRPYRAVAKIKVGRDGKILGVSWVEKSPSAEFNNHAQKTFKRIKRLPVFPPQVKDESLEVQYEFISTGWQTPRRKLEARDPAESAIPADP